MYKTREEVEKWLGEMGIKKYTIRDDLTVDVFGDVNISWKGLTEIPIQFGKVEVFLCSYNRLVSLKGCPEKVEGNFWCHHNKLVSLQYCPHKVSGSIWCHDNKLVSLKGCPVEIGIDFSCDQNRQLDPEYQVWLLNRKLEHVQN